MSDQLVWDPEDLEILDIRKAFNPKEPRDEKGRWTKELDAVEKIEWDESKHPRDKEGKWTTISAMETFVGDDPYKGSFAVNSYLRDPHVTPEIAAHAKAMIHHIDNAFKEFGKILDQDTTFYRGVDSSAPYHQSYYEPGYLHVTKRRAIAQEFADQVDGKVYQIRVPKGTTVLETDQFLGRNRKEQGVLLPRGLTLIPRSGFMEIKKLQQDLEEFEKAFNPKEPRDSRGRWTKLSDTHTLHFEGTDKYGFHRFSIKKEGKEIGQLSVSEADDGSLWIDSPAEIRMKYDDFLERDVPVAYPIKISSAIKKEIEKEMLYRYPNKTLKGYVRYKAGGPSADNLKIVRAYTNQDYVRINQALREGLPLPTSLRRKISALDSMMQASSKDQLLYRSSDDSLFGGKSPVVGEEFTDKAFVSTSTSKSFADDFGHRKLTIETPKGTRLLDVAKTGLYELSEYGEEAWLEPEEEVILARGTTFRVVSTSGNNTRVRIVKSLTKAFNPQEARDEFGRWTATIDHRYDQRMRQRGAITVGPRLSLPQQTALRHYVDFNMIAEMEKQDAANAVASHQLTKDTELYRGVAPQVVRMFGSLQPGQIVRRNPSRFTSTSKNHEVAKGFAKNWEDRLGLQGPGAVLKIEAPKYSKALDMKHLFEVLQGRDLRLVEEAIHKEEEILLNLGVRMRYEGMDNVNTYRFTLLPHEEVAKAFNPMQPRDKKGRWAATASYSDKSKFSAHIRAYKKRGGEGPQGEIFVRNPKGEEVRSISNWMDYPEYGWKWRGVDLYRDWKKHERAGTVDKSVWRSKVPLEERLKFEAKHQALAHDPNYEHHDPDYAPLKAQFAEYKEAQRHARPDTESDEKLIRRLVKEYKESQARLKAWDPNYKSTETPEQYEVRLRRELKESKLRKMNDEDISKSDMSRFVETGEDLVIEPFTEIQKLQQDLEEFEKAFNPKEPRDEKGRWTKELDAAFPDKAGLARWRASLPKVLYHGTERDLTELRPGSMPSHLTLDRTLPYEGVYLTDSPVFARQFGDKIYQVTGFDPSKIYPDPEVGDQGYSAVISPERLKAEKYNPSSIKREYNLDKAQLKDYTNSPFAGIGELLIEVSSSKGPLIIAARAVRAGVEFNIRVTTSMMGAPIQYGLGVIKVQLIGRDENYDKIPDPYPHLMDSSGYPDYRRHEAEIKAMFHKLWDRESPSLFQQAKDRLSKDGEQLILQGSVPRHMIKSIIDVAIDSAQDSNKHIAAFWRWKNNKT